MTGSQSRWKLNLELSKQFFQSGCTMMHIHLQHMRASAPPRVGMANLFHFNFIYLGMHWVGGGGKFLVIPLVESHRWNMSILNLLFHKLGFFFKNILHSFTFPIRFRLLRLLIFKFSHFLQNSCTERPYVPSVTWGSVCGEGSLGYSILLFWDKVSLK
jgi:hypothetical protein